MASGSPTQKRKQRRRWQPWANRSLCTAEDASGALVTRRSPLPRADWRPSLLAPWLRPPQPKPCACEFGHSLPVRSSLARRGPRPTFRRARGSLARKGRPSRRGRLPRHCLRCAPSESRRTPQTSASSETAAESAKCEKSEQRLWKTRACQTHIRQPSKRRRSPLSTVLRLSTRNVHSCQSVSERSAQRRAQPLHLNTPSVRMPLRALCTDGPSNGAEIPPRPL
mmetsp:Transcript_17626/g.57604  ORF Transcript_17626/g.57604 Transcript_17626/m.57604 type:complete len:224 (-) Transcript_17626:291-962(-)